jgi:hypothetical protein
MHALPCEANVWIYLAYLVKGVELGGLDDETPTPFLNLKLNQAEVHALR